MGASRQIGPDTTRGVLGISIAGLLCICCPGIAAGAARYQPDPWQSAVTARAVFEAEPVGTHTRADYARVLDRFRAIYHGDPSDTHAARAVDQVAELLAEQGREFGDRKSLHDAARQYEFLADQYPASSLAPEALGHALELLGPAAANDSAEAHRVRAELDRDYPRYARVLALRENKPAPQEETVAPRVVNSAARDVATQTVASQIQGATSVPIIRREPANGSNVPDQNYSAESTTYAGIPKYSADSTHLAQADEQPRGPVAQVTGIRHWSTSTYTRVAIDLGNEVQYEAARVENPDRIFFDLHHAHLAPELAGKSFSVTDDGFLTRIRAAQFSGDVTRVVLDVHEVAEYSAFLLPNPYRLIIDIHGKRPGTGSSEQQVAETKEAGREQDAGNSAPQRSTSAAVQSPATAVSASTPPTSEHYVPPSRRRSIDEDSTPSASPSSGSGAGAVETAGLPPMPVTDGSAAFGLPPRRSAAGSDVAPVAPPRVVIPAKATPARPVPNTVTSHNADTSTAVAAVSEQPGKVEATSKPTSQPVVSRSRDQGPGTREQKGIRHVVGAPAQVAPPTADGETSMMRALGLKIGRIVIDAGHGGHDSGTLGVDGIEEKDVVLDVALRLGKLLHDRLGAEIVYTRADDTFIPLETRTAIANKAQADLFISVHANSSPDPDARGVEVYYLNFTSDPDAMRVASRENAVSTQSVHDLSDLVKKIALKDKIDESRELATDVDESLYKGLAKGNSGLKDRGVKKAPFVVLIGANMPSVLAEISFVTNPTDADKLSRPEYRQRVAESLYGGIARYAAAINGRTPATERADAGSR